MNKNSRALRKQFFQKRIPEYRKNPVLFAREVLIFEPDDWQKAALIDLAQNPKVAIKSGQGVGKTGLEAVTLLWFLCCYPYPRIVATAPTKQQLHDVLWSEVSKWMSKSPLLSEILKWTKTYIYIVGMSVFDISYHSINRHSKEKITYIIKCLLVSNRCYFGVKYTDDFVELPVAAQALYFHLGMRADDDGFVSSPKKITKMVNCTLDDLNMLNMSTKSLDEYISDDGGTSILDLLSSDEKVDALAGGSEYQRELHEELEAALSLLDDKTALMIRCAYYQRNNYTKTAEIFGCSRQAVDERIKKGFYKILHSKHRKRLESFMWEGYHVNPRRLSDYADMEEIDNMGSEFLL